LCITAHVLVFANSLRTVGLDALKEKVLQTSFKRWVFKLLFVSPFIFHFKVDLCYSFALLQVISRKDQGQYWFLTEEPYSYVSVDQFVKKFKESQLGKNLEEEISKPFDKSKNHKSALSFTSYSLTKWEMFKACSVREFLLMKRNSFIYVFKTTQVSFIIPIICKSFSFYL